VTRRVRRRKGRSLPLHVPHLWKFACVGVNTSTFEYLFAGEYIPLCVRFPLDAFVCVCACLFLSNVYHRERDRFKVGSLPFHLFCKPNQYRGNPLVCEDVL
ncbi:hypothetical protein NDU88_006558, partial [Pleurodeles waltl]